MARKGTAVVIGKQGRVVIPADIRNKVGLNEGDILVVRAEEGRIVLEKRERVLDRVMNWFVHVPADVSLADELIAERRAEATREDHG